MTISNPVQIKMIKNSIVSAKQEVIKNDEAG